MQEILQDFMAAKYRQRYFIGFPGCVTGKKFHAFLKTRLVGKGALLF